MAEIKNINGYHTKKGTRPLKNYINKNNLGIQPYSWESEVATLCCILLDNELISYCLTEDLTPEDFYDKRNALLYSTMLKLYQNGDSIDFMSLSSELSDQQDKIPIQYLMSVSEYLPAPMNIKYFVKRIKNFSKIRKYLNIAKQIEILSYETEDPEEIEKAISDLLLKENTSSQFYKTVSSILNREIKTYEIFSHGAKIQQRAIWGILGATSAGKTEFSLDLTLAFISQNVENVVLFCEYEGTEHDLILRIQRKAEHESRWNTERVFIAMKPSFLEIIDFVRRYKEKNILIIVDYLQRFARKLQAEDQRPTDNLRLYVNNIYGFFDNLRNEHPNISVCLLMSMSKSGINEISRQKKADKVDLLNSIKESGDVQYDLDYSYAMLFSDDNDENERVLSLSRFTQEGKAKKYMHLYPIKEARIGEPLKEAVYAFSAERYSYELLREISNTTDEVDNGL